MADEKVTVVMDVSITTASTVVAVAGITTVTAIPLKDLDFLWDDD